ncbi:Cpt-6 [Aphelenchoides bicaudatus]|nr:Cpt-6 [Aphelenchoides bicaudatus]
MTKPTETNSLVEKRRRRSPFRFNYHYPSLAEQSLMKVYNYTFNSLYPIRPLTFGSFRFGLNSRILNSCLLGLVSATFPLLLIRFFLRHFVFRYKRFLFEDKPSLLSKFWGVCFWTLKRFAPPRLRSCDSFLPKQPLPSLKETIQKYLQSMSPLMNKIEYKELERKSYGVFEQRRTEIAAPSLVVFVDCQKLRHVTKFNHFQPFWEKYAYLSRRDNLIVNSSICCVDCWGTPKCNQPTRAAHIVYGSALNMLSYADESQKPLADGLIFSGHYNRLYCNSRVPGHGCDSWTPSNYTRHFVCLANGCFYKVDLFDPETKRLYTVDELTEILTELLKRNDETTEVEQKLASLTQDNRDQWAQNRKRFFLADKTNSAFLDIIETAMVFLVMDEADNYGYENGDNDQLANFIGNMLTGNGKNRWTDKPINFIIGKNGRAGACSEHSVADGAEYFHITENKFFADLVLGFPEKVVDIDLLQNFKPKKHLKLAERMELNLLNGMETEIERCFDSATQLINDTDMSSYVFEEWGKGRIKKCGCSPDAFIQMAIQLSYFKDQGNFTLTYESASSRFFDFSRTETMRTVSQESCAFVRSVIEKTNGKQESARLLIEACKQHQHRTRLAMTGQGIDRHLFVLYVLSRGNQLDSPFLEHFIQQPWKLSTTQIGYVTDLLEENGPGNRDQCWLGGSFGATHKDGYGVGYRFIGNHSMVFHVTSYRFVVSDEFKSFSWPNN